MPHQVLKHACNLCNHEYWNFDQALQCEAIGMPTDEDYQVGDIISFEQESGGFGTHWAYSGNSGTVLHKQLVLHEGKHIWIYVVDADYMERGVVWVERDFGKRLFSPSEFSYRKGYAAFLQQQKI